MKRIKCTKDRIIGLAIGDALGVPVEFCSRAELDKNPVVGMREFCDIGNIGFSAKMQRARSL